MSSFYFLQTSDGRDLVINDALAVTGIPTENDITFLDKENSFGFKGYSSEVFREGGATKYSLINYTENQMLYFKARIETYLNLSVNLLIADTTFYIQKVSD